MNGLDGFTEVTEAWLPDGLVEEEDTLERVPTWPAPPEKEAFHGLPGRVVEVIAPESEADPVAILAQTLVLFGNLVGRAAHFRAEADSHYMNLFATLVGSTSKGRKGTSFGQVLRLFTLVDEEWAAGTRPANPEEEPAPARVKLGGLSSGEGLIWCVRDDVWVDRLEKRSGNLERVMTHRGEEDKRLLVVESEFAQVLKVMAREGNTLSPIIRNAWDRGDLQTLTSGRKSAPLRATGAHISILGHITADELRRHLGETEMANGFGNRFLWLCVKRSKCLPEGGRLDDAALEPLARDLRAAAEFSKTREEIERDPEARAAWHRVYPALSEGASGMVGAMTSRAEAQTMRLATLYALMDGSPVIALEHLRAALALWEYAEASVEFIFSETLGDPLVDEIREALRAAGAEGMTRTQIHGLLGRHKKVDEINRALSDLAREGRARKETKETGGRPTERWHLI